MDHPQTPRILAPHLSNFQHRIVRILGKVVQLRGESAIIDAGGHVDVILNRVHTPFFLPFFLSFFFWRSRILRAHKDVRHCLRHDEKGEKAVERHDVMRTASGSRC
tara:strand:- start:8015 stop:8332 length:318 start_codon:yes stop_codon:yes gene_type:complete